MTLKGILRALPGRVWSLHRETWETIVGAAAFEVLERSGIVQEAGEADWYPCLPTCGGRRVVVGAAVGATERLAVCSEDSCPDARVSRAALTLWEFSPEAFAVTLCDLLDYEPSPFGEVEHEIFRVGRAEREGLTAQVFLAFCPDAARLASFVAARGIAATPTVFLVASVEDVGHELLGAHGPGQRVEIVPLETVLGVRNGEIVGSAGSSAIRMRAVHEPSPEDLDATPFCRAFSHEGERLLSRAEYLAVVASAGEHYDHFLDALEPCQVGRAVRHRAFHRRPDGSLAEELVRVGWATAVAELVEHARQERVEAKTLPSLRRSGDAEQLVRRGLQAFDPIPRAVVEGEGPYAVRRRSGRRWIVLVALRE
jgi:hypothetical protein